MRTATTATDGVLNLASALARRTWPELARERIRFALIDCIACIVVGSTTDAGRIAASVAREAGGDPCATVLGAGLRAPMMEAALVNGTAAHALDYDDIVRYLGHPSVVLAPAVLAAAEKHSISGERVLTAYGVGFEVMSRLLRYVNPPHFDRGWHATSTIGIFGATAAVATMLDLEPEVLRHALGIAASSSSGLRKAYGSMVKPLHAGLAAHNALLAVELARKGFVADMNALDGDYGFLNVYRGDTAVEADFESLMSADRELAIVESGLTIKRFACCGASHAAVDGILELRRDHPEIGEPGRVRSVRATVNRSAADILFHHVAHTGDQGRFSMEYSLAAAMLDGWLGVAQFENERVRDPVVQDLSSKVEMVVDPNAPFEFATWPAHVEVVLTDGRALATSVDLPKGHRDRPLGIDDLRAKFSDCCGPVVGQENSDQAFNLLRDIQAVAGIGQVTQRLIGPV